MTQNSCQTLIHTGRKLILAGIFFCVSGDFLKNRGFGQKRVLGKNLKVLGKMENALGKIPKGLGSVEMALGLGKTEALLMRKELKKADLSNRSKPIKSRKSFHSSHIAQIAPFGVVR